MKISLVQPRWRIETDSLCEPLNLGYLASYLETQGYKNIDIYSAVFDSDRKIVQKSAKSKVVGINVLSSMWPHVKTLASKIKERNANVKIVVGGVHPTALPEETLENKDIDYVVRGEGEITFYELIESIRNNTAIESIDGISYKKYGKVKHNEDRNLIQNLDAIPFPARDLIIQESYIRKFYRVWKKRSISVVTSRGCPYNCSPCASSAVWKQKWRARSPKNVIEELNQLVSVYNIDEVHFEDANFAMDTGRIFKICELMEKSNLDISWNCLLYPEDLDKELLKAMKYAGCNTIGVGIESGSKDILKQYGKSNISFRKIKEKFDFAKELDINRIAFFMLGLPGENKGTISKTKRFMKELQPDYATCSLLVPFPGTEFYNKAKKKGYITEDFKFSDFYYTRAYMPTDNLSREELFSEYKKLINDLTFCWRKRKFRFWPLYYKFKVELTNTLPREYLFLLYRIFKHLFWSIFNRLFKVKDL